MEASKAPSAVTRDDFRVKRNLDRMFDELFESGAWLRELGRWEDRQPAGEATGAPRVLEAIASDTPSTAWSQQPPLKKSVLQSPLLVLRRALRVLGIVPYTYVESAGEYQLSWRRTPGLQTLMTASYMTALFVTAAVGVVRMFFFRAHVQPSLHDNEDFGTKAMGAVVLYGCLVNAWAELLNAVYAGRRLVRLLNSWNALVARTGLDPTEGLRTPARMQVGFLVLFSIAMVVMTAVGRPVVVTHVIDGVGEAFFMIPPQWLIHSPAAKVTCLYLRLSFYLCLCLPILHGSTCPSASLFLFIFPSLPSNSQFKNTEDSCIRMYKIKKTELGTRRGTASHI